MRACIECGIPATKALVIYARAKIAYCPQHLKEYEDSLPTKATMYQIIDISTELTPHQKKVAAWRQKYEKV